MGSTESYRPSSKGKTEVSDGASVDVRMSEGAARALLEALTEERPLTGPDANELITTVSRVLMMAGSSGKGKQKLGGKAPKGKGAQSGTYDPATGAKSGKYHPAPGAKSKMSY
jgi:hypothetical protein